MTAIELAAIASAAVPGLNVTAFAPEPDDAADFSSALIVDAEKRRWRVRSPRHVEASARLETERQVLRAFAPGIRAELPFLLPTVAGTVRQGELITFVYSHIAGKPESVESLTGGGAALALEIGAAIAAIHDLNQDLVTNADLPSYSANEFRQRKLNELDQAATTGKIPPSLLRRWEHAMEDVALWRFNPSVVHGDLHEDNIFIDGTRVTAVMGWTDLRIGDPADDFAWLVAINDTAFVDTVMQAYAAARNERPDPHLLRRAALSAEFALAQWLVKGYAADSARMVEDAESMLRTLEADINEHGGQPISTEPARKDAAPAATTSNPAEAATGAIPVVVQDALVQDKAAKAPAAAPDAGPVSGPAKPKFSVTPIPADEPTTTSESAPESSDPEAPREEITEADASVPVEESESADSASASSHSATSENPASADASGTNGPESLNTTSMKVIPLRG